MKTGLSGWCQFGLCLLILALSTASQARVFDFKQESFSPYLNLRGGLGALGRSPVQWQAVEGWAGDRANLMYGGEFGVRWWTQPLGISLGFLVQNLDGARATEARNGGGVRLFTAQTEALAFGPTLQVDGVLYQEGTALWRLFLGGGYQFARIENQYQVSSTGQSLWSVPAEVSETYRASLPHLTLGVAAEFQIAKTNTMSVQLGYHHTLPGDWQHGQAGAGFTGTVGDGSPVVFEDGTAKAVPWSYVFVQIGFQFYVQTIR